jgi:hypothetical protein
MMTILADQLHRSVAIWIDDVIVYSADIEILIAELRTIFKLYRNFNVRLNPNKTVLFGEEIPFCGKIISSKGIRPNPQMIQGLSSMTPPKTVGELQQFIGAANWIRGHIIDY